MLRSICSLLAWGFCVPVAAQDYSELAQAYEACRAHIGPVDPPARTDPDDFGFTVSVRRVGHRYHIREATSGSGVEAFHEGRAELYDPRRCSRLIVRWSAVDGAGRLDVHDIEIVGNANAAPSEVAALLGHSVEAARPNSSAHAFARAWVQHPPAAGPARVCGQDLADSAATLVTVALGGWTVGDAVVRPQPWYAGRPQASPRTYWNREVLQSLGVRRSGPSGSPIQGVLVPPVQLAAPILRIGRYELLEAPALNGRNRARALAIYDHRHNRHRWVLVTRGCVSASRLTVRAHTSRHVLLEARNHHGVYAALDGAVVVDLVAGVARPVYWGCDEFHRMDQPIVVSDTVPSRATLLCPDGSRVDIDLDEGASPSGTSP